MSRPPLYCLLLPLAMAFSPSARADSLTLILSDLSSDSTPAAALHAELTFEVVGSQLSLNVANFTSSHHSYDLGAIYFNGSDNISSLSLSSAPTGWTLQTNQSGGFGAFDFALVPGAGATPIGSGQDQDFTFNITTVSGSPQTSDFTSGFSNNGSAQGARASIHFINGPRGDQAFGGGTTAPFEEVVSVPVPTALMMGLGLLAGVATRRGRFA